MDILLPTFNHSKIAGSPLGVKHTEKSRRNMSIAQKDIPLKERGHVENCKCAFCNHKVGKEHRKYIQRETRCCGCGCGKSFICMITSKKKFISGRNKAQLGKEKSIEAIEKQKQSLMNYYKTGVKHPLLGFHHSQETKDRIRKRRLIPILQYDLNGVLIKEWDGIIIAAKELNLDNTNIGYCLKGKRKSVGNFIWKYKYNK